MYTIPPKVATNLIDIEPTKFAVSGKDKKKRKKSVIFPGPLHLASSNLCWWPIYTIYTNIYTQRSGDSLSSSGSKLTASANERNYEAVCSSSCILSDIQRRNEFWRSIIKMWPMITSEQSSNKRRMVCFRKLLWNGSTFFFNCLLQKKNPSVRSRLEQWCSH